MICHCEERSDEAIRTKLGSYGFILNGFTVNGLLPPYQVRGRNDRVRLFRGNLSWCAAPPTNNENGVVILERSRY